MGDWELDSFVGDEDGLLGDEFVGELSGDESLDGDESLVYEVTKTLWEQREQVVQKHPAGRAINPRNAIRDTGTPFH
ncbi:MAG: TAXI family TRAP transporter solute-binding subunit, partial [Ilumatobacteraceae bacterium]